MGTPFELMVAPNGARLQKADHPGVPITPAEMAATAAACADAGASAIHVHARDAAGRHTLDAAAYAEVLAQIRARTTLRVQVTTEAAGIYGVAAQRRCLAEVDATDASVALREIARDPAGLRATYAMAAGRGIEVQHILYDADDLALLLRYFDDGVIAEGQRRVLFVLGRYAPGQVSTPDDLTPFLRQMGQVPLRWSACAFGAQEQACLLAALQAGGHARIGFENNRTAPDGRVFQDNAASVAAFVTAAAKAGFTPMEVPA